jgi:hypothetical protein
MHDNPIHTFFQVLGGNIPDQLALGGYRWFEVALYTCAHGMFAVAYAGRSLGVDILLAKRLIPGVPYDGLAARAVGLAS